MIMGLCILLIDEVCIVSTNQFDAILLCQLNKHLISLLLQWESLTVGPYGGVCHLMTL